MKTVAKWNIQLIIKEKIMETHLQLKVAFETYLAEHDKFEQNGVKAEFKNCPSGNGGVS